MLTILLVYEKLTVFKRVKDCFVKSGTANVLEAQTSDVALKIVNEISVDLVIVAEQLTIMSGIQFVNILVQSNPLIITALVSSLSPEDFHAETEGLGVLMQLPLEPQESDVERMLKKMERIITLMTLPQSKEVTV